MTVLQQIIIIALCSIATMLTRFLPFLVFRSDKPTPEYIKYLGKALPAAIFGMLVIYCLKNVNVFTGNHGVSELLAILLVIGLYLWQKKWILSIAGGTVFYMLLIQAPKWFLK